MKESFPLCKDTRRPKMSPYAKCLNDKTNTKSKEVEMISNESLFQDLRRSMAPTREGRVVYISRHGESLYNLENRIGGNPALSPQGMKYAKALGSHVNSWGMKDLKVWTSELRRTHQTAQYIDAAKRESHAGMNELDSGLYDDITYEEFEERYPEDFIAREKNKLTFRYPQGESYVDVCKRLEPVLERMDQESNLLVICHQAVIRCILAFLLNTPGEELPYIKVPLHTILKVTFSEGQNRIEYHHLPIECVDTYRPKMEKDKEESPAKKQKSSNNKAFSNKENVTYAVA